MIRHVASGFIVLAGFTLLLGSAVGQPPADKEKELAKLKGKLALTKNPTDKEAIVARIKRVSPLWKPMAK